MHIRRLDIENFRAIHHRTLRFDDALGNILPVTVLAGANGSGKTSVLYAIVQALRRAMRAGISDADVPPPSSDDIHRREASGRRPVFAKVQLELVFGSDELGAIRNAFAAAAALRERAGKSRLSPPDLVDGRITVSWQYPPRTLRDGTAANVAELISTPEYGAVWLNGAHSAWQAWRHRLIQDIRTIYPVGMLRMFPQTRDRRWGIDVDESDDAEFGEKNGTTLAVRSPLAEELTVLDALRRLGEWAHGQGLPADDDRKRWEMQLQQYFKGICAPKEYLGYWLDHARYGETPLLSDNGHEYPYRAAASGELVILHYLTTFTFPRPVHNSLVLIDEPELHLHPKWIRQLYRALPLMGSNNQFIMTTHSPELRQMAAADNALVDLSALDEHSEVA